MKALTLAALVVALVLNIIACGTDPVGSHSDGMAVTADAGPTGSDIAIGTDGSKTDADASSQPDNSADADSGGTQADKVGQDGTADAAPFCPQPGDDPKATLEIKLADGPQCFVPGSDKAQMALDFVNAKMDPGGYGFPKANMMPAVPPNPTGGGGCATISGPDFCFPFASGYGKGYKPQFWGGQTVPFEVSMYLRIKFPDSMSPETGIEVALKECSGGVCSFEDVVSVDLYQVKVTYTIKTKEVVVTTIHKEKAGVPQAYKLE